MPGASTSIRNARIVTRRSSEAPYPTVAHQNEYGLEISYVLQLTETMTLQPDIQVIFDPADNTQSDAVAMFTFQVTYTW